MTLIVKLCCNNTLNFLIISIILGILSKNFADDQRSATVSKNAPNATTNAFSDLPQKTQNWTRYLSVSTGDDSVFKQVSAVANDASSSWVLVDGYELRQLPYSFPQENRPGYIHYRGTNNPDAECKQYQPQFSGIAGFIGGGGTQNNDYAWSVITSDRHVIFAIKLYIGGSDGHLAEKNYTIVVRNLYQTLINARTGHSGWRLECYTNDNSIPHDYTDLLNKKFGLWYDPGKINTCFAKLREFLRTGDHDSLNWPGVFRDNDAFYVNDKKDYIITGQNVINLLNFTRECFNKNIYNMENGNCTDLTIKAMEAAGLSSPAEYRHSVTFRMQEKGNLYEQTVEMSLPEIFFLGL
jgi:hypothetical protein